MLKVGLFCKGVRNDGDDTDNGDGYDDHYKDGNVENYDTHYKDGNVDNHDSKYGNADCYDNHFKMGVLMIMIIIKMIVS